MATISMVAMRVAGARFVSLSVSLTVSLGVGLSSASTAFAQSAQGRAPAPMTQEPPAGPLTARLPAATATTGSSIVVHLEGSDVAELQQDTVGDHRHWVTVCSAPCDQAVPTRFSYRIAGDGIRNSRVFTLRPQSGDREIITVDESSKGTFVASIVGTSVGGLVMVVGLFVLLIGALENVADSSLGTTGAQHDSTEQIGGAMSVIGLAGVIVGSVGIASNARSGVTQGSVSSPASWLPPGGWASPPGANGAFKDARRDASGTASLPPAMAVPFFAAHF